MNKWLENDLALRLISIGVAILMWFAVTDPSISYPTDGTYSTRIRDVSIEAIYDQSRFELVEMEKKVELILYGDKYTLEHLPSTYRIYVDLGKLGAGTHRDIPVQVKGLPRGVESKVNPEVVKVVLEEKLQREMPVDVELIGKLPEGFNASQPVTHPSKVRVRGSESKLEKVKSVKAIVNLENSTESISRLVKLQVYGDEGPLRNVEVYPEVADVEVPINSPNKQVPLNIEIDKFPPPGYAVESIKTNIDTVTVYGPQSYIDSLQYYTGPKLDLSNVAVDRTILMPIPVRDEATKVEPKAVEIYVKMVRAETKSFANVPVQVIGTGAGLKANILSPKGGSLDVTLSGAPKLLEQINGNDIKAYIDVANLPAGKHEVPIQFQLPSYIQVVGQFHLKATVQISS